MFPLPEGSASAHAGAFVFEKGKTALRLESGARGTVGGTTVTGPRVMQPDTIGPMARAWRAEPILPKQGRVMLDVNKVYNPPWALTPYATCPLPPKESWLPVAVEAGEKSYAVSAH